MNEDVVNWLLEDNNPAIKYRTQTELLDQSGDIDAVKEWIFSRLPANWFDTKGLWYVYYLTALAECGLTKNDAQIRYLREGLENATQNFEYGCADFMILSAFVKLGFCEHESVKRVIDNFQENNMPDGGFLCKRRLKNFNYTPKSCYKANLYALMFLAEYHKKGYDISFGQPVIDYFLNRNIFYKSKDKSSIILNCTTETFHPFEPMRVGIHNIVESFSALGYGNDEKLQQAWTLLNSYKDNSGKLILHQTLTKSYLPKEKAGKASKWVTFYSLLAEKEAKLKHNLYPTPEK